MFYINNQRKGNSTTWISDPILILQHWKLNRSLQGETRVPMKNKHFGLAPKRHLQQYLRNQGLQPLCAVYLQ